MTEATPFSIKLHFNCDPTDLKGCLHARELKAALRAFGFEVKKSDVQRLLDDQGKQIDDPVDLETFRSILREEMMNRDPMDRVHRCFELLDVDGTGKINVRCLKRVCKEIGETVEESELQDMIDEFDRDGDGWIDRLDFEKVMTAESDSD